MTFRLPRPLALLLFAGLLLPAVGRGASTPASVSRSGSTSAAAVTTTAGDATVLLAAVGDVLMHSGLKRAAMDQRARRSGAAPHLGFDWVLSHLRPKLRVADLAFCNVEFPVIPRDPADPYHFRRAGPYDFRAPPEALGALRWAGVTVGSLANNHIWNAGRGGLASTLAFMAKAGIAAVGAGRGCRAAEEGIVVESRGIRIAFLGAVESGLGANLNEAGETGLWVNRIASRAGNL